MRNRQNWPIVEQPDADANKLVVPSQAPIRKPIASHQEVSIDWRLDRRKFSGLGNQQRYGRVSFCVASMRGQTTEQQDRITC